QIGGAYTPAADVAVVSRDNSAYPVAGKYNICCVNTFQTQPEAASFWQCIFCQRSFAAAQIRRVLKFEDSDWPGKYFLDTRTDANRQALATIINGWIDTCHSKGFNAIEPDNLDTFSCSNKLLTADNNLALAKLFTYHAHSLDLAVAQKNTGGELGAKGKSNAGFDFAVAEECQAYGEFDSYTAVYGNNVLEIEYTDNGISAFQDACKARASAISVIYRDCNVAPSGSKAYHYQEC
ncbi:glycoside hydrolase family 114 protein, partial [Mycena sanguinolenta]